MFLGWFFMLDGTSFFDPRRDLSAFLSGILVGSFVAGKVQDIKFSDQRLESFICKLVHYAIHAA